MQDLTETINQFMFDLQNFLNENFPILIILLLIALILLFYGFKSIYYRRDETRRTTIDKWKSLKAKRQKLTDKLNLKIYPFGKKAFEVRGDIYVLDSTVSEKEYKVFEMKEREIDRINTQIKEIKERQNTENEFYDEKEQKSLEIFVEKLEKKRDNLKNLDPEGHKETLTVKEKTETYVSFDRDKNEIVGFRLTGLKPAQNVLSQTGFYELSMIDPRRTNKVFLIIIGVLFALLFILFYTIYFEIEPSFLFTKDMWGWYVSLAIFVGAIMYVIKILFGFYAVMYSYQVTTEDVKLEIAGNENTINIDIYWVTTYFYPNIDVSEVLNINLDDLSKKINTDNQRLISEQSTIIASLKSEIEFQKKMLNKKAIVIDTMEERLQVERALGYHEGRKDNEAVPTIEEMKPSSNLDWNEIVLKIIPLVFGLIAFGIVIIGAKYVADSISLDSTQTTVLLGGIIVIGVFLLLMSARALFESTSRRTLI